MILAWLALTMTAPARAVILFVDLNNAPQEYAACKRGAGDDNVHVVSRVFSADAKHPDGQPVGIASVRKKMDEIERTGGKIDSIVISGHDGSGHFMGLDGGGDFYSSQLKQLLAERPQTRATLVSQGLIGCYTNNVHGAKNYWLMPNSNVKMTVGFAVQSPTKEKPATAKLVESYCKNRVEWANAQSKSELCDLYPKFNAPFRGLNLAICTREAVASEGYKKGNDYCFSYEEMQERCKEYDPNDERLNMFAKYMAANDPCEPKYQNPPADINAFYAGGASELRKFYSDVHLWKHCADDFKKNRRHIDPRNGSEGAYNLPDPPQVIRLVKYDDIKKNLGNLNAAEIADFDRRLEDLCLGQYALGDVSKLSRAEMNRRLEGATRSLMMSPGVADRYGFNVEPPPAAADPGLGPDSGARAPASSAFLDLDDVEEAAKPTANPARAAVRPPPPSPGPVAVTPPPAPAPPTRVAGPTVLPTPKRATPAPVDPNPAPAPRPEPNPATGPLGGQTCGQPAPRPVRACRSQRTDPAIVHVMAQGLKRTFVDLNYYAGRWSKDPSKNTYRMCSHFHLVEPNAEKKYKSQCILGYNEAANIDEGIF